MRSMHEVELASDAAGRESVPLRARLPDFVGLPPLAEMRLRDLKVAVVGCGAVGGRIAEGLARLQVRTVWLIDGRRIKGESVLTHSVLPMDIGRPKASHVGGRIKHISPASKVFVFNGALQVLDLSVFADADYVLLATDNLLAEIEVGQRCLWLALPLIQASVHGASLVTQIRFFSGRENSACPACGFSRTEWNALNRQTRYSCEHLDHGTGGAEAIGPPTMSVSFLCAIAADLALIQLTRHALALGAAVENSILEYCGYTHKTVISPLTPNPACPCDHTGYDRTSVLGSLADFTPGQLAELAGYQNASGQAGLSFLIGHLAYCEFGICRCAAIRPVRRFVAKGRHAERCRTCGEPVRPHPFHTHIPVPAAMLQQQIDRSIREMGGASAAWAMVRGPQRSMLFTGRDTRG